MKKNIWEAARLYMKAYRCVKKAEKLLKEEGVIACSTIEGSYEGKREPDVQIYSGILEMEDTEHKLADRPSLWKGDKPREDSAWLKIEGINFFECKSYTGYTLR